MYNLLLLLFLFLVEIKQPINNEVKYHIQNGDKFYDSGGPNSNYQNCTSSTDMCTSKSILCGDGIVSLQFNKFKLFNSIGDGDRLRVLKGTTILFDSNSKVTPGRYTGDSCIIVEFVSTSIGNDIGWDATLIVDNPPSDNPPIFPPPSSPPCRYTCKSIVSVNLNTNILYNDLVMNPLEGCNYDLMFTDTKGNIISKSEFVKGETYIYKAGDTNVNYCWGYIKIE